MKIAIVSTVRAPLKQLEMFVNYHLNIGVDQIILFFDDPDDKGFDIFSNYKHVRCIKCDSKYWFIKNKGKRPEGIFTRQVKNVNHAVKHYLKRGYEWVIHIDSDELLRPIKPIRNVLENMGNYDAIRFRIFEAVSENLSYETIYEPTLFRVMPDKKQRASAKKLGCKAAFFEGRYFRADIASKMAIRINPEIKLYKVHNAIKHKGELSVLNTNEIQLLHFDCVDFASWSEKWNRRLDGSAPTPNLQNSRKAQLDMYIDAKNKGENSLTDLFRQLHMIPKSEQGHLFSLEMLERIQLNPELFNKTKHCGPAKSPIKNFFSHWSQ